MILLVPKTLFKVSAKSFGALLYYYAFERQLISLNIKTFRKFIHFLLTAQNFFQIFRRSCRTNDVIKRLVRFRESHKHDVTKTYYYFSQFRKNIFSHHINKLIIS